MWYIPLLPHHFSHFITQYVSILSIEISLNLYSKLLINFSYYYNFIQANNLIGYSGFGYLKVSYVQSTPKTNSNKIIRSITSYLVTINYLNRSIDELNLWIVYRKRIQYKKNIWTIVRKLGWVWFSVGVGLKQVVDTPIKHNHFSTLILHSKHKKVRLRVTHTQALHNTQKHFHIFFWFLLFSFNNSPPL